MTKSALDQFNHLADLGHFTPASDDAVPTMPSMYRSVPTITTYGTQTTGANQNAQLGFNPSRDIADPNRCR